MSISKKIRKMLELHEQGRKALKKLLAEQDPSKRKGLYDKFKKINDTVGIPTQTLEEIESTSLSFSIGTGE